MKRTNLARLLATVMIVCLVAAMVLPTCVFATDTTAVAAEVKEGVLQVNLVYTDDDNVQRGVYWGTGFLINDTYVVTCDHVISVKEEILKEFAKTIDKSVAEVKSRLSVSVTVTRDVTVPATVFAQSGEMDFAILKLNNALVGKTPLKIRNAKEDPIKQGETVISVGFPSTSADYQAVNTFTGDDATVTSGIVNKASLSIETTNYIQTSCNLDAGNSGGPMVDANGAVVGVCQAVMHGEEIKPGMATTMFYNAIDFNHVLEVLIPLGVPFGYYEGDAPEPATEAPTDAPAEETTAPVEETTAPTLPTTEPTTAGGPNLVLILGISAAAVVLIIVAVVVLLAGGKKKSAPAAAAVPPVAPVAPAGNTGFAPVAPTYPIGDAGETSVLSGGAGETTVLSNRGAVSGGTLIRKRTGEVININADQFVIGRERKSVNYCIADNTSVSRNHVRLTVRNGMVYMTDLGAANGTFINGVKLQPRQEMALKNGDKITLADEELEYKG